MFEQKKPIVVVRGEKDKEDGTGKEDTVVLWKTEGCEYMTGIIKTPDGVINKVMVFSSERKLDESGEKKPNYLVINKFTDNGGYETIGYGNAVNSKKGTTEDIYYDEILFNLNNIAKPVVLKATVIGVIDDDFHQKLGFLHNRILRESN